MKAKQPFRIRLFPCFLAIVAVGLTVWPLFTALAWSPLPGGELLLNVAGLPMFFGTGLAILVLFLSLGFACFPRFRRSGVTIAALSVAFFAGSAFGIGRSLPVGRQGWKRVIARAEPLVAAIHSQERRHGTAPERLEDLVPAKLAVLPTTGVGSSPEFRYRKAEGTNLVMGDHWALRVNPPQIGLGFDTLFDIPSEQYPERGFGGGIEKIGRWAYVHE